MNQQTKDGLMMGGALIVFIIFVGSMLFFMNRAGEYWEYRDYYEDGYNAQFTWKEGCKIQVKNQNNYSTWEYCYNVGDEYVVKNFAVKRNKQETLKWKT